MLPVAALGESGTRDRCSPTDLYPLFVPLLLQDGLQRYHRRENLIRISLPWWHSTYSETWPNAKKHQVYSFVTAVTAVRYIERREIYLNRRKNIDSVDGWSSCIILPFKSHKISGNIKYIFVHCMYQLQGYLCKSVGLQGIVTMHFLNLL